MVRTGPQRARSANGGNPRRSSHIRFKRTGILLVALIMFVVLVFLSTSLYRVQVQNHAEMSELASGQYYRKVVQQPARGDILDRNGKMLATTSYVYRIGITPKHVRSIIASQSEKEIAERLATLLELDLKEVTAALARKDETYIQLAKNIPQERAKQLSQYLDNHRIGGVRIDSEPTRVYRNDNLASQVIGFTGLNEGILEGRLGIEYQFNQLLSGKPGFVFGARDNYVSSGLLPFTDSSQVDTKDGYNITLTLDLEIQKMLQDSLSRGILSHRALRNGMGIVMNINSGEILGMASYPYFSSADPTAKPEGIEAEGEWNPERQETIDLLQKEVWRNKAISDVYEPGSTVKALTSAMAFEEDIANENSYFNDAPIQVLDHTIHCWSVEGHGMETLQDAFYRSCNPVFVQLALQLGNEKYYDYMRAFGFYEPTGVQLPGEGQNIFHQNPSQIDLATLSFGEQSSVTPLHLVKAFAALGNGGNIVRPTVIKQISDKQGNLVETFSPKIERQVVSAKTSSRMRKMLQGVVDYHSYLPVVKDGYQMGGKTSTSTDEVTGYHTISFACIAPIDDPELVVLLILQHPDTYEEGGKEVVLLTTDLTAKILEYMNVERNYSPENIVEMKALVDVPDLNGMTLQEAALLMAQKSIIVRPGVETMQADDRIAAFVPAQNTQIHRSSTIYVYPSTEIPEDLVQVPDFTGMNYNECINLAGKVGVIVRFEGDLNGLAVSQSVAGKQADGDNDGGNNSDTNTDVTEPNVTEPNTDRRSVQKGSVITVTLQLQDRGE